MTFHRLVALIALLTAVSVAGCQGTREILGQGKRQPDEFAVYARTPLSVPPGYALRPPGAPAAPGQQPGSPSADARSAILGRPATGSAPPPAASVGAPAATAGTAALLRRTGGATADPNVRNLINRESSILAEADRSFTERLIFWRKPTDDGPVIDAKKESERIREAQARGQPLTEGETPTIQRRQRALLQGILN